MDSSTLTILRHTSDSADKIGSSDPDTMDRMLDLESGPVHQPNKKPVPGMWRYPTNPDLCCIYRVPGCLREVNPKAYTPQLVIIGPLHHTLRSQALKSRGDITKAKSLGYLNTETHKKIYLKEFAKRVEDNKVIEGFKRKIKEDEAMIRASYSESTAWIESAEFLEMILHDSVFIIELMLRFRLRKTEKIGDPLMDEPCLENTIKRDLILLENQLPYFILEKLFNLIVRRLCPDETLRTLVISYFELDGDKEISGNSKFRHFTDLFRLVRVDTLPDDHGEGDFDPVADMHNAVKLDSRRLKFEVVEEEFSVEVTFDVDTGCLKIPCFRADDDLEIELRNVMAFEQSHYPYKAYVCDYVTFLDFLIDTERDVDFLVEKGIIKNWLGHHGTVSSMVNKLCSGVVDDGSSYSKIASKVMAHYNNKCNKSRSILKRVYFTNLWRGTATITAACILLLTLIQTVTSIIGIINN